MKRSVIGSIIIPSAARRQRSGQSPRGQAFNLWIIVRGERAEHENQGCFASLKSPQDEFAATDMTREIKGIEAASELGNQQSRLQTR